MYSNYLNAARGFREAAYRAGDNQALNIAREGTLSIEYAPFDYIEQGAELAIAGLTPGRTQAVNALQSLSTDLNKGIPVEEALARAKRFASFSGAMRNNLLAMLDDIGIPSVFGRSSASDFFRDGTNLVHFTSALRYPVYVAGKNYSGTPNPLQHHLLRQMMDTYLAEEVSTLSRAIWIPLGGHAEAALLRLAAAGLIERNRIMAGLPHPSGANAERISYFLRRKSKTDLSSKTNAARIDAAKESLLKQIAGLIETRRLTPAAARPSI